MTRNNTKCKCTRRGSSQHGQKRQFLLGFRPQRCSLSRVWNTTTPLSVVFGYLNNNAENTKALFSPFSHFYFTRKPFMLLLLRCPASLSDDMQKEGFLLQNVLLPLWLAASSCLVWNKRFFFYFSSRWKLFFIPFNCKSAFVQTKSPTELEAAQTQNMNYRHTAFVISYIWIVNTWWIC